MLDNKDALQRKSAIEALGVLSIPSECCKMLRDPEGSVRSAAVAVMKSISEGALMTLVPELLPRLQDPGVCWAAASIIGQLPGSLLANLLNAVVRILKKLPT